MIQLGRRRFMITLLVINTLSLYGCVFETDDEIASKKIEQLLIALDHNDNQVIKELFAIDVSSEVDFENDLDELINYYQGVHESVFNNGLGITVDKDDDQEISYYDMSYDVTTSKDVYRMGIIWNVKDTSSSHNVGIWSLYILNDLDDTDQESAYRSEGLKGIHVAASRLP